MRIEGATVLLTGATGGLGRAIATGLAGRGARLILSSRKSSELEQLAGSLPGDGHTTVVCDLADDPSGIALIEAGAEADIFVANAALPATGRLEELSAAEVGRIIDVNLASPVLVARELLGGMKERGEGHLVFISSLSGKSPSPRASMYNATKFGLRGFALALRQDLREANVGVSLVLPGFVRDAGMFADAGIDPPPGAGTSSPEQVAEGVISAITGDRAEVVVAPPQQRIAMTLFGAFPRLGALAQRGLGEKVAERLAAGQRDKR
ncbi:MAG: SDR family NAD(P)-dependent oxidoreductase [Solirubrobacterales bacterium]